MGQLPSAAGWVYILTNPALPGLIKVGLTTRTPSDRAAELAGASGVPLPFVIAWSRAVSDCASVEAAVHRMLNDRRVSGRREFFRCDVATARQVIEAAAGSKLGRRYRPAPPRLVPRQTGQERAGTGPDRLCALAVTATALVAGLVVFQPAMPGWMPASLWRAFMAIERLRG